MASLCLLALPKKTCWLGTKENCKGHCAIGQVIFQGLILHKWGNFLSPVVQSMDKCLRFGLFLRMKGKGPLLVEVLEVLVKIATGLGKLMPPLIVDLTVFVTASSSAPYVDSISTKGISTISSSTLR